MKASEIKTILINYALNRSGHIGAFTEVYYGQADVMSVTANLRRIEYEIKVNKYDFLYEANLIELLMRNSGYTGYGKTTGFSISKWYKHRAIIQEANNITEQNPGKIPNYFYFAVSGNLGALAFEKLKDTPYGLIVVFGENDVNFVKMAKLIHPHKLTQTGIYKLLRKASFESYNLRKKLDTYQKEPISKQENST